MHQPIEEPREQPEENSQVVTAEGAAAASAEQAGPAGDERREAQAGDAAPQADAAESQQPPPQESREKPKPFDPARRPEPPDPRPGTAAKAKRGRPLKLTPFDKEHVVGLVTVGCSRRTAARYLGCSPGTLINEMRRDENFAKSIRQAEVHRLALPLKSLCDHADRSWRAAAWFVSRLDPKRFGRQQLEVAPWNEVEKLFNAWAALTMDTVQDPKVREEMKARAEKITAEVKRCHRRY